MTTLYRVLLALLGFAAVVTEIATLVERGIFVPANFFSYFTIEGNLFTVAVLLAAAVAPSRRRRLIDLLRGAATLYMVVIFLVFSVLLAGLEDTTLTAVPWDNTVLHYVMPLAVLADWLLDPPRHRISFRTAASWLAFPIAYVGYSLVRGGIVGWYPYPFLDPADGYAEVAVVTIAIAVVGVVLAWAITRRGPSRRI